MLYEHRLYEFEKWQDGSITDRLTVLSTPKQATWYALKGWTVFDFTASLDMEPEYYETERLSIIGN